MFNLKSVSLAVVMATASVAFATPMVVSHKEKTPPAQLGISPARIENTLVVSKGERLDKSFVIYNYHSTKAKSIKLNLIDINSAKRPIKPNKKTLLPYTIINPTQFVIPPNGQQTVRLSIRPPVNFPKKAHYGILKIDNYIDEPLKVDKKAQAITVTLGASYGLPIIVNTQ